MFQQLLYHIFSARSQLQSLQLNITELSYDLHRCLTLYQDLPFKPDFAENQSYCTTLRRLDIHLHYRYILEDLVEHVPNLEYLSVYFELSLTDNTLSEINFPEPRLPNENWANKVREKCNILVVLYVENKLDFNFNF